MEWPRPLPRNQATACWIAAIDKAPSQMDKDANLERTPIHSSRCEIRLANGELGAPSSPARHQSTQRGQSAAARLHGGPNS